MFRHMDKGIFLSLCLLRKDDSYEMYVSSARNVTVFSCKKMRGREGCMFRKSVSFVTAWTHQPGGTPGGSG